ncbi:MAG: phospholipase D-like domain-containing protein [Verrucomicrobiales bacterium]
MIAAFKMKLRFNVVRLVIALGILLGAFDSSAVEKLIRVPIVTDYSVEDPAFAESVSQLLRAPLLPGNHAVELLNGIQIFPAMLEDIRQAQETITFENFIWRSGQLSDRFIEALSERARAGVKVHCIVDGFGALKFKKADQKRLRESGVQLEIFNPIRIWNPMTWNHRTHRKTLVVDGRVGFTGGICIADEWDGNANHPDLWRDTEYRFEGPVVGQTQGIFMDNWLRITSEVLHGPTYFPTLTNHGNMLIQAFKSGPKDGAENARLLYLYSIAAARKTIRICHSYFVPDNLAIDMLVAARKRGVKVEIITPGLIDMNVVRRAARSRWNKLLEAGVQFYEYQPTKLHTKVMIVDDVWTTCGSVNFDDRSFRINDEANINILDRDFAARQIEVFEADKALSVHIEKQEFFNRPLYIKCIESFCGLFRGLL